MPVSLSCIVEGHGEVSALPVLLRRLALEIDPPIYDLRIVQPIRIPATRVLHSRDMAVRLKEIGRATELAARKLERRGGIVVLFDLEDDCPATRGPELLAQFRHAAGDVPCRVILAYREYETWFLAAAASLRLPGDAGPPRDPESIRGAKGWLGRQMGRGYEETTDQAAFSAIFDMQVAATVDSFRKLRDDVRSLLAEVAARYPAA